MMRYMIRYSEIGLKSPPVRRRLISLLRQSILDYLEAAGMAGRVEQDGGHLYLTTDEPVDRILARTFGVRSFSRVEETTSQVEDIVALAVRMTAPFQGPFAVRARRTGDHPYTSMDLAARVGAAVVAEHDLAVDLTEPADVLHVEVRGNRAYLYRDKVPGPGGLPLGSQRTLAAVVDGPRGLAAAWLMMRRGCRLVAVEVDGRAGPLLAWDPRMRTVEGSMDTAIRMVREGETKGIVLGIAMEGVSMMLDLPTDVPVYTPLVTVDDVDAVIERVIDPPVVVGGGDPDRR